MRGYGTPSAARSKLERQPAASFSRPAHRRLRGQGRAHRDVAHLIWLRDRLGAHLLLAAVITSGPDAYRRTDGFAIIPASLLGPCKWHDHTALFTTLVDGVRCLKCGATRWTMSGVTLEHLLDEPCEVCGGETVVERRRPGTGAARPFMERRDLEKHARQAV